MPPLSVVEALDVLKERTTRLVMGPEGLAIQELTLERGNKAFCPPAD
jgi:hypothetical protein